VADHDGDRERHDRLQRRQDQVHRGLRSSRNQHNQAPAGGLYSTGTHDPIGDIIAVNEFMYTTYGIRFKKAITSRRVLQTFWKTNKFTALAGVVGGAASSPIDPNYLLPGWGPQYAINAVEQATGVKLQEYDSIYRTRAVGANTWTNQRFLADDRIYFLADDADLGDSSPMPGGSTTAGIIDGTQIGFAKTLTAPHPEGNWASGYYEWEMDTKDPWQTVRGTGIKAFPVFPFMEYSYTLKVL
jgi:hypothetical protein